MQTRRGIMESVPPLHTNSWCVFGKLRNLFARGKYRGTSREEDDWTVFVNV